MEEERAAGGGRTSWDPLGAWGSVEEEEEGEGAGRRCFH